MKEIYPNIEPKLAQEIESNAKKIVENFYQTRPYTGRTPSAIGSASLYISCKQSGFHITLEEMARISDKGVHTVRDAYALITKTLKIKI
jgi:transcription initiation factor TFIIIB Brf1 subunit/transcription initiation factor TFIIB